MAAKLEGDTITMQGEVTMVHDDGTITVRLQGCGGPITTTGEQSETSPRVRSLIGLPCRAGALRPTAVANNWNEMPGNQSPALSARLKDLESPSSQGVARIVVIDPARIFRVFPSLVVALGVPRPAL